MRQKEIESIWAKIEIKVGIHEESEDGRLTCTRRMKGGESIMRALAFHDSLVSFCIILFVHFLLVNTCFPILYELYLVLIYNDFNL